MEGSLFQYNGSTGGDQKYGELNTADWWEIAEADMKSSLEDNPNWDKSLDHYLCPVILDDE